MTAQARALKLNLNRKSYTVNEFWNAFPISDTVIHSEIIEYRQNRGDRRVSPFSDTKI